MVLGVGVAVGVATVSGAALGTACTSSLVGMLRREPPQQEQPQQQAQQLQPPHQLQPPQQLPPPPPMQRLATPAGAANSAASLVCWEGFSMEEARRHADAGQSKAASRTPEEVFADLQRGNARFWTGAAVRPEASAFERRALISKQYPSVAVLGCSDSRVPTEIIFDQGLGDIFVVRVAGNALDVGTSASLQYAVHHLKVKVLVILGHEFCGAIKAAQLPVEQLSKEPSDLSQALLGLKKGLDQSRLAHLNDTRALDREAVTTNVRNQVERLTRDDGFMKRVREGELLIVGGFYEISSGIVDFFHEVSAEDGNAPSPKKGVSSRFLPGKREVRSPHAPAEVPRLRRDGQRLAGGIGFARPRACRLCPTPNASEVLSTNPDGTSNAQVVVPRSARSTPRHPLARGFETRHKLRA
eukprot:CAMPEP_0170250952 /NCGR_PEP_ID=MMETSP0116_2-20130129/25301_1 /TAXON_ID=400756 /ORGANISM="Durinskia baltica, Strain CSIRO CS-38" /LENGTH=412 /DNA_ID=CAMNT_0010501905 /DNA_START=69 /DNA_END=1308 /DNA_ORIENTATION=+